MAQTICKAAILIMSGLFVLTPLSPIPLTGATFIAGIVILLSSMPSLGSSYKKPVYAFLLLSLVLYLKYQLPLKVAVSGVNSMLSVAAIVAVLQIFVIPINVGGYDSALEKYLQTSFKKEVPLYIFLHLITHLLGSFMLFGTVPMLYTIFGQPLNKMVQDPQRFSVTAMNRSFALVTLWAPGAVNVILALQATGARWLHVFLPSILLALLGLGTSVFLETKLHLKDHLVQSAIPASNGSTDDEREDRKKILTLLLIAVVLIVFIVFMEQAHVLTSTTRVLVAGLIIALIWILRYAGKPGLYSAWRGYWEKSINVVPDLAALFISIGIFAEAVKKAGLMASLQTGLLSGVNIMGQYSFFVVPPVIILLSLVGFHPFISIIIIGQILVSAIQIPQYEVFIALSLLLGGGISYVVSPFSGNVLTLSKMADCSPREVAFKWNGLFSVLFLLEGLVFLFIMQIFWY